MNLLENHYDLNRFISMSLDRDTAWEYERLAMNEAKNQMNASLGLPRVGRATSPWMQILAAVAAQSLATQKKIQRGTFAA